MAQIYIEGLGNVNIQGNVPTPEEEKAIANQLQQKTQDTEQPINTEEQKTQSFTQSAINALKSRETGLAAGGFGGFATGARFGAMGGSMVGGLPGAVIGGLAGGVLGATGAGQVYDILDSYIQGENKTFDESTKQALKDIKTETMFSMIGQTIPGIKPAITRLLSKREKGELVGKDAKELYDAGKRIGVDIVPLDISKNIGKLYGKVAGVFPLVGRPIKELGEARGKD